MRERERERGKEGDRENSREREAGGREVDREHVMVIHDADIHETNEDSLRTTYAPRFTFFCPEDD